MKELEIAGRKVGPGHPCFIIAEAGVNHNGDVEMAGQLVEVAAVAGADGNFHKPNHWFERSDKDGIQTACTRECITEVADKTKKTDLVLPI